ncbi:MAG: hypothetical protein WC551_02300 [Patescibacteria group bacterium]
MSDANEVNASATPETTTPVPAVVPTATSASALWQERIGAFAKSIGKPAEDVTKAFVELVGDADDDGLETLTDPECCTDQMITEALGSGVPPAKFKKAVKDLRGTAKPVATTTAKPAASSSFAMMALPDAPTDETFLSALQVGGVAKMGATEVNAALRVMLAKQLGVYDLPEQLVELMENRAEEQDEPVSEAFYDLQKQIGERKYGEILQAMGVSGRIMSEARKNKLLARMDGLWATLRSFQECATGWQKQWQDRTTNPTAMIANLTAMLGGNMVPGMPGMMDHPEVAPVLDAAAGVIDVFNKMFAGTGIPVARAMAQDSLRIKQLLEKPELPAAVGCTSREEMLKKLGAAISADYVRLEKDLVTYVLAIMKLAAGEVPPDHQPYYIVALQSRGLNIPWDKLLSFKPTAKPSKKGAGNGETDADGRPFARY